MKIKITENNATKIVEALKAVNGRAYDHAYTEYCEIDRLVYRAEKALHAINLPRKSRSGALYVSTSGDKVPNSYKYSRSATRVTLQRGSSAWYLVAVEATTVNNNGGGRDNLRLTAEQDAEAIRQIRKNYSVQTVEEVAA